MPHALIPLVRRTLVLSSLLLAAIPAGAHGAEREPAEIFKTYCVHCHGDLKTGEGHITKTTDAPFDFKRCDVASAEPVEAWRPAIRSGGPAVGLSVDMPAFAGTLTDEEIESVALYLRRHCTDQGWPNGDLNLPRPILTEKAFPEDEVVILPAVSHRREAATGFGLTSVFEKRLGKRANVELELPFASFAAAGAPRTSGFRDVAVAGKYALYADRAGARILSIGLEAAFPTASESRGLGEGRGRLEPFVSAGWRGRRSTLQTAFAYEFRPTEWHGEREFVYNLYAGHTLTAGGTGWTVGTELNGENREVAVTPQIRKGLVRTGALAAAVGFRLPLNERDEQGTRVVGYVLWDYREPVRRARRR